MRANIILIGFMGTGKSTIGFSLSKAVGYPLLDTDDLLTERAGKTVPEIFEEVGEAGFRKMESEVLSELAETDHAIISTGGGIVTVEANRKLLKELGYVVWLSASPETILSRTSRNRNRPLLDTEDPLGTIRELMAQRREFYEETAHLVLDTGGLDASEITAGILDSARYYLSHH